ncbi:MAG TPA: DUF2202 domain-containing protein [Novosphingobium sp.]|nr:DUF2202 domain-containing protein [Novosphingobium sp.]HQA18416.1 DUF2202 domain-containing protein [Novosphingobium sp.]
MNKATVAALSALAIAGAAAASQTAGASSNDEGAVKAALLTALDDEYKAEATYQAVLDKHGDVRPFSNIIRAEQRHQEMVKAEMDRRGWSYGPNPYSGKITAPATLLDACKTGVQAEVENIALYDRLLPAIDDPAAKSVLERLQWASRENHLPAFERCVARGGTPGRGPDGGGGGGGGGWGGGQRRGGW